MTGPDDLTGEGEVSIRPVGFGAELMADLKRDEGLRLKPYRDSVGKLTIGYGRNLDDNGITEDEAGMLLDFDVTVVTTELDRVLPWWRAMPLPARRGLANMCFNLGLPRLRGFVKMLAALRSGDWYAAADEALDSRWARQVGARADRIARLYRQAAAGDQSQGDQS